MDSAVFSLVNATSFVSPDTVNRELIYEHTHKERPPI